MATTSLVLLADTVSRGDPAQIDLSARPAIWEVTAAAIYADPWQGVGLGLYPDAPSVQLPLQPAMDMRIPHAHNLLLQVGADLGLAGLVTYLALLITATAMCARIVGRRPAGVGLAAVTLARRGQRWALGAGATAALAAMLAHGVVDAVLWGTKLAFVPWLLLALIAHLFQDTYTRRRVKHRREAPP
ncbi:MAG: O-antigen ligase family protein [Caldilineaceae bacterium]|nr:O-antigen ligase family protein [Caldilineaceae bacterium]